MELPLNQIIHGDCLEVMKTFPDKCVDLVLTDPPYGTTSNEWDVTVDFWSEFNRICKTGFIIFSSQPFTTDLIQSNRKDFKYCWVWNKGLAGNFAIAKYQPLKVHEEVCIFGSVNYYPLMTKGKTRIKGGSTKGNSNTGNLKSIGHLSDDYYPSSILNFINSDRSSSLHPTQKPVNLIEYLLQTYSKESDIIFDPFGGSCTTAIACINLKRNYICIEKEKKYVDIGLQRIASMTKAMF